MKSPEKTEIQNDGIIVIKPNGWQILRLRKKMGWSQGDMAKRLHLNSSTMISRYERDVRGMSPAAWELICIKARDEYHNVKGRQEEIKRRMGSVMFINELIRKGSEL